MIWRERHELIINGIDFDAALERERNKIHEWIDSYIFPININMSDDMKKCFFNIDVLKQRITQITGIPKI